MKADIFTFEHFLKIIPFKTLFRHSKSISKIKILQILQHDFTFFFQRNDMLPFLLMWVSKKMSKKDS